MAASGRLSQLLETGQARAMLSSSKDVGACPSVWTVEDALGTGVSEVSLVGACFCPRLLLCAVHVLVEAFGNGLGLKSDSCGFSFIHVP